MFREAIETAAYGLGMPIDIWAPQADGTIAPLSAEELDALRDAYSSLKEIEKELLKRFPI